MPVLAQNQPFDSPRPNVVVENALAVGRHRFALTVVDDSGLESAADELVVEVRRLLIDPTLPPVVAPPTVIVRPTPVPPVILRPPPIPPVGTPRRDDAPADPGDNDPPR